MAGLRRWTATVAVSLLIGLTVMPASLVGQGTTAFPLLSYRPVPSALALRPSSTGTPVAEGLVQEEEITYRRQPLLGAAFGALIGGAVGFVAGGDATNRTRGENTLIGAAMGAGVGLIMGYFIKTPVIVEDTALGEVIPDTFSLAAFDGGSGVQLGWHRTW
jgi:hypothetical protein